ncbi:MAG: hypothetical protein QOJ00_151 [Actinomycetota bacterium]|jgi:EmrB/QacA subfamily drug resistance transporter
MSAERATTATGLVRFGTPTARWIIAGTALGSGVAFLDGTVVNIALPAISAEFHASLAALQWTVNAYLVMLSALLLLGGSLGDHYGRRRVYVIGLAGFTGASLLCGLAPNTASLIAARAVQGVGAALLVPGSLSIIAASFDHRDRGQAIGAWSGLAGVSTALGPFLGGWLIEAASWRLIFLINVPLAGAAIAIALRHVPESRAHDKRPLDLKGAAFVTVALAALSFAAINHAGRGGVAAAVAGVTAFVVFIVIESRNPHAMMPLALFKNAQFSGGNLVTLTVYAALSGSLFLVVLQLQRTLHYSPLEAGAATVPFTLLMLTLSPLSGRVASRIGARLPMTVGPLFVAASLVLFSVVRAGSSYVGRVLPAVGCMGLGMAITVAPLTAAVLADIDDEFTGIASGINNAVSRFAGLLAVAALPALAGINARVSLDQGLHEGYATAMRICAGACAVGAAIAFGTIRKTARATGASS